MRALSLRWTGHTDVGRVRKNNEDAFLCLEFDAEEVRYLGKVGEAQIGHCDYLFAVSDGMGGANAGEFASKIAVEKITKLLPPAYRRNADGFELAAQETLEQLFHEIHEELIYLGGSYDECRGMGATLTLCWLTPWKLHYAHIGDSRLYLGMPQHGRMKQLTDDDTHVGWLFRNGQINERQARTHPAKNALQRALGAGHQIISSQTGSVVLEGGERLLLCSDGLIDGYFDSQLEGELNGPDSPAAVELVQQAVLNSGRDNTTALIIEVSPGQKA